MALLRKIEHSTLGNAQVIDLNSPSRVMHTVVLCVILLVLGYIFAELLTNDATEATEDTCLESFSPLVWVLSTMVSWKSALDLNH